MIDDTSDSRLLKICLHSLRGIPCNCHKCFGELYVGGMVRVIVALVLVARVAGLASGPNLIVNTVNMELAVSALSSSSAVVCYISNSYRGVYEHSCV